MGHGDEYKDERYAILEDRSAYSLPQNQSDFRYRGSMLSASTSGLNYEGLSEMLQLHQDPN